MLRLTGISSRPRHLSSKVIFTLVAIAVLALAFVAYVILQADFEQKIRATIFEQHKQQQVANAKSVSNHMQSDLDNLMTRLQYVTRSNLIQDGEFSGPRANAFLKQVSDESSRIGHIDAVMLLDENNRIVNYHSETLEQGKFLGVDLSKSPAMIEFTENQHRPTFSNGFISPLDGSFRIALIHPIHDDETGEYIGAVSIGIGLDAFIKQYGNTDDVNSQYIGVLDRNWTILASPFKDAVGRNYHDPILAQASNEQADAHFEKVLSGQSNIALFNYRTGDRLNAGEPIVLGGKPTYFLFSVTPTDAIYAEIASLIASYRSVFYLLEGGIVVAIGIASFFLTKSWTLEKAVNNRTRDLQVSNEKLASTARGLREANIQLKTHDRLKNEFINVAAHELRTPMTSIMAIAERMEAELGAATASNQGVMVSANRTRILARNAKRLDQLAQDVLDITRIESNSLKLKKEEVSLEEIIAAIVHDFDNKLREKGLRLDLRQSKAHISVHVDSGRITQVLVNLLSNAIKFTKSSGTIMISADEVLGKEGGLKEVLICVKDTGSGIDPEIMPKLFSKFASKSEGGIGLGLYISKAIVEAHGGRIWAENNEDNSGATFYFSLPSKCAIEATQMAYPLATDGANT